MKTRPDHRFSGPVTILHELALPERATPAGYAALIKTYRLTVPTPRTLSAVGEHHRLRTAPRWRLFTPRYLPPPTLEGHLTFALKYEGLDLAVLTQLFDATGARAIEKIVRGKPTGSYARRVWFLYEWLTSQRLKLADVRRGDYVDALDTDLQFGAAGESSSRQRVRNNLPGTPDFCPLVFRTPALDGFTRMDLKARARAVVANVPRDLLARTAAFLLLKDSKSSYAIEGERPPQDRIQRWGRAIGEAGRHPLTLDELLRLQEIVIGDGRFVKLGIRKEGGFVGEHDRSTGEPLPDHISARPEDLHSLIRGMVSFDSGPALKLDPVIAAAILAFGFVYARPFEDGNGRIHRYLIHHVLANRGFNPSGVVFPVSSAILDRLDEYKKALEDYSKRLLPVIQWAPTAGGNVVVKSDTADFYRYFDATPQAEFLFSCVLQTIEQDLPNETEFLARFDRFHATAERIADMPQRMIHRLFLLLKQNGGRLGKNRRTGEFKGLTDAETKSLEAAYAEIFGDDE